MRYRSKKALSPITQWFDSLSGSMHTMIAARQGVGKGRSRRRWRGGASKLAVQPLEARTLLAGDTVLITEFMASNDSTLTDGDGNFSDWIEIHNPTSEAVDLAGSHLSDDADNLDRWTFPALPQTLLAPGEYLVVFASGQAVEDYVDAGGYLHTDFRLSAGGEYLGLVQPGGSTIVHEYAPSFPAQTTDVSFGLEFVGGMPVLDTASFLSSPTPGAANSVQSIEEMVQFFESGRTFSGGISVVLSGAGPEQQIVFTTDGSTPDDTSRVYAEPIFLRGTTQVRARIIAPGLAPGPVRGESYILLSSGVLDFTSNLPIIVIENFEGGAIPNKGFNPPHNYNLVQTPRQTANWSIFDTVDGAASLASVPDLSHRAGIRVRGAFSATFPQPGYSIETWDENNDDEDVSPLGLPAEADWILYAPNTQYDDSMLQNTWLYELANQSGKYAVRTRFVEAFVNEDGGALSMGDYRGVFAIFEKVERGSSRIDFEPLSEDGSAGGWLLEINRVQAIPESGVGTPQHFHTAGPNRIHQSVFNGNRQGGGDDIPRQSNGYINFDDPNGYVITTRQRTAIMDWFDEMEDVLYGPNWLDPVNGYRKYIDTADFIDYLLLHDLTRNGDGLLISLWVHNEDPNNGGKLKIGPNWDYDLAYGGNPASDLTLRHDRLWYPRMFQDPEFAQQYQDRWQQLRQGAFSNQNMRAIMDAQAAEIGNDAAARHGLTNFFSRVNSLKNFVTSRADAIDARFTQVVAFNSAGGVVPEGFQLRMTARAGSIYYTLDGSDPRLPGGGLSPSALLLPPESPSIVINETTLVRARARARVDWSGVTEALFLVNSIPADADNIRVTEINYNPFDVIRDPVTRLPKFGDLDVDNDEFEFIEIQNVSDVAVNLAGVTFAETFSRAGREGIEFSFVQQDIAPGEYVLVVADPAAFESRYGAGLGVVGQYAGRLDNGGEALTLWAADGSLIQQFTYNDGGSWPGRADGNASSLEVIDPAGDYFDSENWRASTEFGGSPGAAGRGVFADVIVNEVLTRTAAGTLDAIELYNTTSEETDIAGWFLSDSNANYFKFAVAAEMSIPAGGYRVFDESDFNPTPGVGDSFALNGAHGDDVWLLAVDALGKPARFADRAEFGATEIGVSLGRWPNGTGDLFPMTDFTPGAVNSGPRFGPIIISEVMYNPTAGMDDENLEFVELYNTTGAEMDLGGWRLADAVDVELPAGTMIGANGTLVLVHFDPSDATAVDVFRSHYAMDAAIALLGPYSGQLDNGGQRLQLVRPDTPPPDEPEFTPLVLIDEVNYDDQSGWPTTADGQGDTLTRRAADLFGNFETSWSGAAPTPGTVSFAPLQPGDADGDGDVDVDDLNSVRNNFGSAGPGALGDTDGDGDVDVDDLNNVRNNFGAQRPLVLQPRSAVVDYVFAGIARRRGRPQPPRLFAADPIPEGFMSDWDPSPLIRVSPRRRG